MVNEINTGLEYIDKVFHVADIHVRNLKRHAEYREVFESLYVEIEKRKTPNSVIFLAGDIAHAKTEMSPELVSMISKFFNRCAELCPTFVIPGNHDANLNNSYRMDVLSPIVENINNDRIIYLKNSGIYKTANVNFVHYGIFEDKENWPDMTNSTDYNIGLFHGPIHSSRTDIGYTVTNNSITVNSFAGCKIVMCGDIHKRQIVDTADDMMIVYAGSLIQQNHGEALAGHGFVEWDITMNGEVSNCQFIDIKNEWGYYTLEINNGVVPIVSDMPKNPRLRIRVTNTPAALLKRALATVRKRYKVKEFTVTRMDTMSRINSGDRNNALNFGDVTDIEHQNALIKDYLTRHLYADIDIIEDIYAINRDLNSQLDENTIAKNVNWKPKKFAFSNMFSYGEKNTIDFTDMKGIYGMFAPNASGKSSLFDSISFCIFDKCSRAFKASHVMNNKKFAFECKLELEIGGVDYFIIRTAKLQKAGNVKVDVAFWKEVDGEEISLNGEHRRGTNDMIRQYIGSYEDFVLTTLSLQDKNAIFIDKSQSERKDLLAQFMGIDIFDKLYNIASENIKDVSLQIKKLKSVEYDTKLVLLESNLSKYTKLYKSKESELSVLKREHKRATNTKLKLVKDIIKINPAITDIVHLENVKVMLSDKIKTIELDITDLTLKIKEKKASLKIISDNISKYEKADIRAEYKVWSDMQTRDAELMVEIETIKNEIERKSEQLYEYGELEYDINCTYCVDNADKLDSSSIVIKRELKDNASEIDKLLKISIDLNNKIKSKPLVEGDWLAYTRLLADISGVRIDLAKAERSVAERKGNTQRYSTQLKETIASITEYYQLEASIKQNKKLNVEIAEIDVILDSVSSNIDKMNKELLSINGDVANTQANLDMCNTELNLLLSLENTYKTYEYYLAAVKRDGIPYELITKALPVVEGEVNNILQQVVDFGMVLEMDGKNINGKIVYEDDQWPLEMCSGMERFISGLSIRVALMNICHLPRSNFLVIDEGMGSLDSNNINNLAWLFDYLKGQFDFIMVISHLDVMRDIIDNLIEIKKVDGFSSINY